MRDYAELVKALRHCIITIPCVGCPYYTNGNKPSKECSTMNFAAADAIEELLAELTTIRKQLPRWISVEDELPEFGERVLVSNGGFVCESFLSQSGRWQRGGVDMFFMTPTHWTEIPRFEPPKEESKR